MMNCDSGANRESTIHEYIPSLLALEWACVSTNCFAQQDCLTKMQLSTELSKGYLMPNIVLQAKPSNKVQVRTLRLL